MTPLLPLVPLLPAPRSITIFRGHCCWLANIPDWNAHGVPLPFREFICALQVKEHLRVLHPQTRIIFEEELQ